jgi:HEAT repeat protein
MTRSLIRSFLAVAALAAVIAPATAADQAAANEKQQQLIEVLKSNALSQEKALACKQLALCGDKSAVPALAALLGDEQLAAWARIAIEVIPDPAADAALRDAMNKLQGRTLLGVINSIGVRRDAQAVDALIARLNGTETDVAAVSANALGRIGGPAAAKALEAALANTTEAVRAAAAEGCLLVAEKSLAEGKAAEAIRVYDVVRQTKLPQPRLLDATRGAILARGAAGTPLLVEELRAGDKQRVNIALRTARDLPGGEVTEALLAELNQASPERQALLILVLADRGDATALPAVLQAAKEGKGPVRLVALRALGQFGGAAAVPVLLGAALDSDAEASQAAIAVLADLSGNEVDAEVTRQLAQAEGKARLALIQLAGQRNLAAAIPVLMKAADDADAETRAAALAALGATVELGDLKFLVARLVSPPKAEDAAAAEEALKAACPRMADRDGCADLLVAAYATAPVAAKTRLLGVLTAMGGTRALEAVGRAAQDANEEIQDAASRLLGEWMTPDAAPVLLELSKVDGKFKIRLLRGYIRIARQLDVPPADRLAMCREALAISERDDEKKLVIEVLRRNPSAAGLTLTLPHLENAKLKGEAAGAAVAIAEKIVDRNPAAVAAAMKRVVEAGVDAETTNRAATLAAKAQPKAK